MKECEKDLRHTHVRVCAWDFYSPRLRGIQEFSIQELEKFSYFFIILHVPAFSLEKD